MNDYIVKGDGASCAHCGATPEEGRFVFPALKMLVWACDSEHAHDYVSNLAESSDPNAVERCGCGYVTLPGDSACEECRDTEEATRDWATR